MSTEAELYEQALEDVLGELVLDEPCRYGHLECAVFPRGACSDEAIARRYGELLDAERVG